MVNAVDALLQRAEAARQRIQDGEPLVQLVEVVLQATDALTEGRQRGQSTAQPAKCVTVTAHRRLHLLQERPQFGQVIAPLLHQPGHTVHPLTEQAHRFPYVGRHGRQGGVGPATGLRLFAQRGEIVGDPLHLRAQIREDAGYLPLLGDLILGGARQQRLHPLGHRRARPPGLHSHRSLPSVVPRSRAGTAAARGKYRRFRAIVRADAPIFTPGSPDDGAGPAEFRGAVARGAG